MPGATAHGDLYSLPHEGAGVPLGRVQILLLRNKTFLYLLHTFLYPLQVYRLFLLERALGQIPQTLSNA